jgi:penicillin amidase
VKRGRVVRLALIGVAIAVVTALVLVAGSAVLLVRRPLPDRGGDLALEGLTGQVVVQRDGAGISDIYADSAADLFRAEGYVHAQERFYEMDVRRRVAEGTLAELVGDESGAVQSDVLARTLGLARVANAELAKLDASTREALDAYAKGVNDYVRGRSPSELSVNYTLVGGGGDLPQIDPWTPADSLAVLKYFAWDLAGNVREEIGRSLAFGALGDADRVDQIYPPYPYAEHNPIVVGAGSSAPSSSNNSGLPARSASDSLPGSVSAPAGVSLKDLRPVLEASAAALAALPGLAGGGEVLGSNAWVISGSFTASGKPMLANDPHLKAAAPGVAFQVGLHCRTVGDTCPYDVSGFGITGLPGVLAGHTGRVSWGVANLLADVSDLYLERISSDGRTTQVDGGQQPMTAREETVEIADSDPITITVRTTTHGALISDALEGAARAGRGARVPEGAPSATNGYGVSLAWTGATPGKSMGGILGLNRASDFSGFRKAAKNITAPALSLVYADVDGHIGYTAAAAVPERPSTLPSEDIPADGTWPQPGWTTGRDWRGLVASSDLPWVEDPSEGFVVAANQAVSRPISGAPVSQDFDAGYRSQRVRDLLAGVVDSGKKVSIDQLSAMQQDTANGIAPRLVPLLLKSKVDSFTRDAQRLLVGWDYTQRGDSAAAAYYNAVWAQLLSLTFSDELPQGIRPDGGARWFEVMRRLIEKPSDKWWDDKRTSGLGESREGIIRSAMTQARLSLTSKLGKDPSHWRWERLHQITLRQDPPTSTGNAVARGLVNLGPREIGGGSSVVDALAWDAASGDFDVTTAPAYRMVVDLGALDQSRWIAQTGVSGHPMDRHYDDQLDDWADGRLRTWPFTAKAVQEASDDELRLTPKG